MTSDLEYKVFVGNMSYSTTAEALKDLFSAVGTPTVQLITRYGKSKGFGFVAFENQDQVDRAVKQFHEYELDGRPLNVEQARPLEDKPKRRVRQPRAKRADKELKEEKEDKEEKEKEEDKQEKPSSPQKTEKRPTSKEPKERAQQGPRKPKRAPKEEGTLSETMIFVGNLPFQVTNEDLKSMFDKYGVQSCKVVTGKFGRSKGFGFVDFTSHDAQVTALSDFVDATVNDRKLVVKAAFQQ